MITYKTGNIFTSDCDAIVNTVNCVGVMGRGIALQFKKKFKENFDLYYKACKKNELVPGKMFITQSEKITDPKFIINFPTKRHWKGKSKIEDIKSGLLDLKKQIIELKISSIAIPPLGAGLGGLDWNDVKIIIQDELESLNDIEIVVFEPNSEIGKTKLNKSSDVPNMTSGRSALIELMHRYLQGMLDPFVSLLEVHKLMYFLQEAGQPLRLTYTKNTYGPYAENLRHVLNKVEGHFVSGYEDGGDNPSKKLSLVPGAHKDAQAHISNFPDTVERLSSVSKLVDGFETPFGLELLATVHWICKNESPKNLDEVFNRTYAWNDRKKVFSKNQITKAHTRLKSLNWV